MNPEPGSEGSIFVTDTGAIEWMSRKVAAIAPVRIDVGDGCHVTVDAARPREVLAWHVEAGRDARELESATGDLAIGELIEQILRRPVERVVSGPVLTDVWARFAEVAGVARWTMRPLNRGALLVDRATAAAGVGLDAVARAAFVRAEYVLLDLVDRCLAYELPSAAVYSVRDAVAAAVRLEVGELAPAARALRDWAAFDNRTLDTAVSNWKRTEIAQSAVGATWTLGGESTDHARDVGFVDIAAVSPRIIAWSGPDQPELLIEYDAGTAVFEVTTRVAAGVDPYCREIGRLLAYAAARGSGALVATAPLRVTGDVLTAVLPAVDRAASELVFGVLEADRDVTTLRTDRLGRCLVDVDRLMVEAWVTHRATVAALHAIPTGASEDVVRRVQVEQRSWLRIARTVVGTARNRLARELRAREQGNADPDPGEYLLRARAAAVADYLSLLRSPLGPEPILAELIAPEEFVE